jgi:prefoldin subunit 5
MYDNQTSNTSNHNYNTIVNFGHYQSAQELSRKAYQIYTSQLRPLSASYKNMNIDIALPKLEQSLVSLESLVNKKADAKELMMLIHGQLHPSLQLAFNLKLKR